MASGKARLALLCVAAVLVLAGCGLQAGNVSTTTATATATLPPTPTATPTTAPTATATPIKQGPSVATITMGVTTFTSKTTVTIEAGQAITLVDPATGGGVHPLVTGTNGNYAPVPGAPPPFDTQDGALFSPGTTMVVTFPNQGTFPITCQAHPVMQLTITVEA